MPLYGALEAGGTKFVVAIGSDPKRLEDIQRFATSSNPIETVSQVVDYFRSRGPLSSLGVATFGPVNFESGCITNTPKLAWQNFPLRESLRRGLDLPVGFDTDVNGAALGEAACGAGLGLQNFVYITVGTGIGGGALVSGRPVHGLLHPEMGHMVVRRAPSEREGFRGVCPFHGDCLEGMASGPAIQARFGTPAHELPEGDPGWEIVADYLAQACFNLACVLSPQAIVFGGGVMAQKHLFPLVRRRAAAMANGYLPTPQILPPGLEYPGLSGALVLAMEAAR